MRGARRLATTLLAVLLSAPASAHRLDELLQGKRVAIDPDSVSLEIDLTPGALTAADLFGSLDGDRDGHVSDAEGQAYGRLVVSGIIVSIDGQRCNLSLTSSQVPSLDEMRTGVGTIRLLARAALPQAHPGTHELFLQNTHRRDISVYQVNALVPATPAIVLGAQRRDALQRELRLAYEVRPDDAWWSPSRPFVAVLGLAVVALAVVVGRSRGRLRAAA